MKHLLTAFLLVVMTSVLQAHHTGWRAVMKTPKCGWLEGDNVHDVTNLSTFCTRWIPAELQIQGVTANRERLWIDAPADLAAMFRDNNAAAEVLLEDWLERWKTISGYRTASVIVLRGHVEVARAGGIGGRRSFRPTETGEHRTDADTSDWSPSGVRLAHPASPAI